MAGSTEVLPLRHCPSAALVSGDGLSEKFSENRVGLARMLDRLGLGRIDRIADDDHGDHPHCIMRHALDAVDAFGFDREGDLFIDLALEGLGAFRQHAVDGFGVVAGIGGDVADGVAGPRMHHGGMEHHCAAGAPVDDVVGVRPGMAYEEAVDHMVGKYGPKYLVGHSMGGLTILYNQYKKPSSQVEKLVTIGAPSEFHEIMAHFQNLLRFNDRVMKGLDSYIKDRFGFGIREFSTSRFSRSIDKKGLILHDRLDTITPYHASVQLHENWKGSILISTEGLGHSMHQDDVNDQIVSFLEA